jgi:transposase
MNEKTTIELNDALSPDGLPDDVSLLKQMILHLVKDLRDKDRVVLDLQSQLDVLRRRVFGRRSEKLDANQRMLFEDLVREALDEQAAEAAETPSEGHSTTGMSSQRNGRKPLPADLPRERIEHHPDADELTCESCGREKRPMGEAITEQLDYVPASFVIVEHVRTKYACPACKENVTIADLPPMPIEKGRPGCGLLAHVLTSKYGDHLPLHRQEQIYRRHGIDLSRKTLCDWVRDSANLLNPIVDEMKRQLLASNYLHTDDTPVPVQDKSKTTTRNGYLWAYIDPHHNVVFDYTPSRSRAGPLAFLEHFKGLVQADAYAGYDALFAQPYVTEIGCWAHARRKFHDAKTTDPVRATRMLTLIGKLYDIERDAKEQQLDPDAVAALRRNNAQPVLDQIETLLKSWSIDVLPKSPIGKAVKYARNQWTPLTRYVERGHVDIDNNLAERILRTVAVGRKNWLFAGSDQGARRAATIYSLIGACKLCRIDPFAYLRDVIHRVSTHPNSRINELTPPNWKPTH